MNYQPMEARTFTSSAELIAFARANRAKLMKEVPKTSKVLLPNDKLDYIENRSRQLGIGSEFILAHCRDVYVVKARVQIAREIFRLYPGVKSSEIARLFGKTHTWAIKALGIKKVPNHAK